MNRAFRTVGQSIISPVISTTLYFVVFIMNSSYAGGESDQSSKTVSNSDLYGAYTLSFGELDWRSITTFNNEPNIYQPVSIDGWIGKRLSEGTEGIIRSKLTYYERTGNIVQPEDDAVRSTFNIEILHRLFKVASKGKRKASLNNDI